MNPDPEGQVVLSVQATLGVKKKIATSRTVLFGPQKVAVWKGNPNIFRKSRLVKYITWAER